MKNLGIFITGAISGAITALLFAPKTGDKTRKLIAKEFDHKMKEWNKTLDKTSRDIKSGYEKTLDTATKQGKELMKEAKEAINSN